MPAGKYQIYRQRIPVGGSSGTMVVNVGRCKRVLGAMIEDRMTVRITEAELASDPRAVLARVREGDEVIVEQDHRPVAVIKTPTTGPGRKLSECIDLAKAHEEELGCAPVPRSGFRQRRAGCHRFPSCALPAAGMGLVLDSGVLIAAERGAKPVSAMLLELEQKHGETEVVISWITVIELEHGLHRANTQALARQRRAYLDTVFLAIPVEPVTKEMGQLAAKIDADAKRAGLSIPFEDLLIGVTALHQGLWDRYAESPALSHDSEPERDRVLAHTAHSSVTVEGPISWQMPWTYVIASGVTVTVTHTVAGTGALDRRPIRSMEFLGDAPELIVPTRLTLCGPAAGRHCHRRSINRGNS